MGEFKQINCAFREVKLQRTVSIEEAEKMYYLNLKFSTLNTKNKKKSAFHMLLMKQYQ